MFKVVRQQECFVSVLQWLSSGCVFEITADLITGSGWLFVYGSVLESYHVPASRSFFHSETNPSFTIHLLSIGSTRHV
jgi:hypothetical protein